MFEITLSVLRVVLGVFETLTFTLFFKLDKLCLFAPFIWSLSVSPLRPWSNKSFVVVGNFI